MRVRVSLVISLLAVGLSSAPAWAQAASPISGVKGKLQKVSSDSLDIQTPTGLQHIKVKQPLTTYGRESSDLGQVNSGVFIGVTSVKQPDGTEQAKEIHIFPAELKGAGEGSNIIDAAGQSRMTNGSVTRSGSASSGSRMTNGTVQKKGGGTQIVVQYQNGAQTISVPSNVEVTKVVRKKQNLAAGDTVYAATEKQPDGTLVTDKVYVISGSSGSR
jgi:hypothetical protein